MAHAEKYFVTYCDDFNVPKRISILERDFEGTAIELDCENEPILITYDSTEDYKFSPIRPSTATLNLIFGTDNGIDFSELWTADEKLFKVEYYDNGSLEWTGYVIPNGFSYELKGGVYFAQIEAADGLSTLDSLKFKDDATGLPYGTQDLTYNNGFEFPFILIVTEILKKLELFLDTWTCVDSYEKSMTKIGDNRDADPLATSFVNVKTFINDSERKDIPYWYDAGEVWNCKEVLENVLNIFGAKIYQQGGVFRIKTINSDVDYGTGATQLYWRKYNTAATYTPNYEPINEELDVLCGSDTSLLIGTDHEISMNDVYAAFRMNYEYTFVREGDTPVNLLKNGDFSTFNNDSKLAAPDGWYRFREGSKWHPRLQDIAISANDAGGFTTGIEMGTQNVGISTSKTDPNAAIWASLRYQDKIGMTKGEDLSFSLFNKYRAVSPDGIIFYYPIYRLKLEGDDGKVYWLRNNQSSNDEIKLDWTDKRECFFYMNMHNASNFDISEVKDYKWYEYNLKLTPPPSTGLATFDIHGLAADMGRDSKNFPAFRVWQTRNSRRVETKLKVVRKDWIDDGGDIPRLQITGLRLGIIPNESEEPQKQDFIYHNDNDNYSYVPDPVTVYNGDVQDTKHVSNIIVPSNVSGGKNFWDTISGKYGYSSLGLLTVREIMNQYFKPTRILEGDVKIQNASFGARYTFDAIPWVAFILQRGTFNSKKGYITDATFMEISSDVLPSGGTEGGNTLDPTWVNTGNVRCRKVGVTNDGFIEVEQEDINSNSESFGNLQWVLGGFNDTMCPIGAASKYYWGVDDITLNTSNLVDYTYIEDDDFPDEVQCPFSSDGGKYIYFLHLDSLGTVNSIRTSNQDEIISDFQYLSDVTIDGYTYNVLRQDYITADFDDVVITFKFA